MTGIYDAGAQKRAVKLTLNSDLVAQAKALTGNLPAKAGKSCWLTSWPANTSVRAPADGSWRARLKNGAFEETHGSLADEFSTV